MSKSPNGNYDELTPLSYGLKKREGKQYVLRKEKNQDLFQMYLKHLAAFWTHGELHFDKDQDHWRTKLTSDERHFIEHVLAFFAASDGIVNDNLAGRFLQEDGLPIEANFFYTFQAMMENIHSHSYSLMLNALVSDDPDKLDKLFGAIESIPCVKKKAEWAIQWIESDRSFCERLVAFAAVEGIFFSGSFCAIFWLKNRGLMPGLAHANELISRDEGMHCDFACLLYKEYCHRLPEETVLDIITSAVDIETEFVCDALSVDIIGMNAKLMAVYIRFCADRLLVALGHAKHYNVENPFDFMNMISIEGKTNFFEKPVSEYARQDVLSPVSTSNSFNNKDQDW